MKKTLILIFLISIILECFCFENLMAGPPQRPVPKQVTSAEITAGTETKLRSYSPADVVSFVSTHGGADAFTVKVDAAATAAYLYNAGSGAVRAGTNVTIDDDGDYITINASLAGGAVDTEGTLNADEIAVMHDLDTIKSLTEAEFKTAYNMEAGTDYLAPISGNDPLLAFDETDGTDWELRVDDTGNSFEIGSSQGGIGDNVELEIDEDGDIHITGDAYIEGALAEVGGTDPIYRLDETDGTDWEIRVDDTGNSLEIGSSTGGVGDNVEIEIDEDGDLHVTKDVIATGDITITGDDIFATTNTAGYIWVGDDTNYNPVAVSGHATLAANGTLSVVDFGLTADADAGDYDIKSVDRLEGVDGLVYVDLGTDGEVAIAADTQIVYYSPIVLHYEATNDGNPYYKIGAENAEETIFQSYYDSGAQTLDYFLIRTETADATADEGRILVQIDEQQVLQIDDDGLEIGANGVDGTLKLYSEQGGTDYVVTFSPHATMTADTAYLLPAVKGTDNQYLKISSQATGQLIWDDPPGTGTVTQVGNDDGGGEVFTEASLAPTGGDGLYFEGTTSNTNEIYLTSVNPDGDYTITLPGETGTVMLGPAGLGTDNILAKMDGTGNLMQATGIVVDDSNNVSSVGTLGTTGDITIVAADPDLILDDSDGADGLIQIAANDADDSVMTLAVGDSGGTDQGYIELDGVNETVDILQNATFAGTVDITGAVTLSSTISDGTATLNSGALSGVTTLGVGDAITLSDGATIDQSANNYVEIAENSDQIQFGFGGTDIDLVWSDGALNIRNAEDGIDAIVEIEGKDDGEKGIIRVLSDGDDKYIEAYHNDTDSWVASSSGDIILAPDGDVDDYIHISTATNVTSISAVGGDGTLGTAEAEWGGLFLGDGIAISFGNDQDVTLTHVADTGLNLNEALSIADDKALTFGGSLAGYDWSVIYDETTSDALEFTHTAGAGADVTWDLNDNAADSTYTITNSGGTYDANLEIDGDLYLQNGSIIRIDSTTVDHKMSFYAYDTDGTVWTEVFAIVNGTDPGIEMGNLHFADSDISPDSTGELVYDNTVTGIDDGALAWYDDDEIKYIASYETLPVDDGYQLTYNSTTDKLYWAAAGGAGSTAWDDITNPDNSGVKTITFDNGEYTTFTSDFDGGDVIIIQISDTDQAADTTGLKVQSADAGDDNTIYLEAVEDYDGTPNAVWELSGSGNVIQDGSITAGGNFATGGAALSSGDVYHRLGDAAGSDVFVVEDSGGTDQLTVDSDGEVTALGLLVTGVGIDGIGAVDFDIGSADITDVTIVTDGDAADFIIGDNSDKDFGIKIDSDTDDFTLLWDEANSELELDAPNYRFGANADEDIVIVLDSDTADATITWDEDNGDLEITGAGLVAKPSFQTDAAGAITIEVNSVNYGTDTGDADIPDGACDSAADVGNWVVLISSAADQYSLTSDDASNIFILDDLTVLDAGDELDVDGSMVSVVCIAAEYWKVVGYIDTAPTDGGVAD